jgi:hypothetical protein
LLVITFMPLYMLYCRFIMFVIYYQQTPLSLTFARPWAMLNSTNGLGVASMFSLPKSTHAFKQEFSSRLEWTDLTFILTHTTFYYGASLSSLGSWAIERQNDQVKHYVLSSLINHYSRVFIGFQNKTQLPLYDTFKSPSICGICGSSPRK